MTKPIVKQLNLLGTETAFAVSDMANAWRAAGNRIFPFHLGDINIQPPASIIAGVMAAIKSGKNGYCPGPGIPLLREQIARVLGEERGVKWVAENVAVQPGGKPVIGKFLAAVMNPGEEVLYPVPGFPIYESQIRYQGGKPVPYYYRLQADGRFGLDVEAISRAITKSTTALIFNNYHNPTGATATDEELDAIANLAVKHDLWLLVDDAYFNIRYDNEPGRSILTRDGMMERSIVLFTCSKQFAMTGWRIGAAIGPKAIINAIGKMNTNQESCTTHFIQQAIGEVLRDDTAENGYILQELNNRRNAITKQLNAIDGVQVVAPPSAFYVYCDLSEILQRKKISQINDLMRQTLEATGVSYCTGAHFGEADTTRFVRFAFSGISTEDIDEGIGRLQEYFNR